ncbi:MAG: FAD-binding protein [Chloroflexi bacterium]|nr:FAD-binding protein [Chloroflexota bacterium]
MQTATWMRELGRIFKPEDLLTSRAEMLVYEYDGTIFRELPGAVVFPRTTGQVVELVQLCRRANVPYVARGAGTGLSGGAIPAKNGLVVSFTKMNKILDIDIPNRRAVVQPGVINLDLKNALQPYGYTYAPDPSSQKVSTIGGNLAENSGGPHCFKYGVTTNHIVGLEVVLTDGQVMRTGGKASKSPGYDLTGLIVGAEGTLGLVTEITARIISLPEYTMTMLAVFDNLRKAAETVSAIIAKGYTPATLEMMDRNTIRVVEQVVKAGYPTDAEAVLLIETDGLQDGQQRVMQDISALCRSSGAREVRMATSEAERELLWRGRRGAFGSLAKLRPNVYIADGTVPRTRLPDVLDQVYAIGEKYHVTIASVFHAGDGNLHPNIMFDAQDAEETKRVFAASTEIQKVCVAAGGSITGEHGVGIEKREDMLLQFTTEELALMHRIKKALDPEGLCNPEKILPVLTGGV